MCDEGFDMMCGCDYGRPCTFCPYNDESEREEQFLADMAAFEKRSYSMPTRIPKGDMRIDNILAQEVRDKTPFHGNHVPKLFHIEVVTLGGDFFSVLLDPSDEDIVQQIRIQHSEFKDDNFVITFTGADKISGEDYDLEFVHSKETLGVLPFEISERIIDGRIDLSDPENNFLIVLFPDQIPEERAVQQEFVFNESDFVELSS